MDIKSPEERSKNMAAIHSKNTNISEKINVCQRLQIWREFKKCAGTSGYIHEKI